MTASIQTIDTPDGPFTILEDDRRRVLSSGWTADHQSILARLRAADRPTTMLASHSDSDAVTAVHAYYSGDLAAVGEVEVVQRGTPLQLAGWQALRRIEPGHPLSYTEFAMALGHPNAVRAAASICARNAPALFTPCHRVLRVGGALGGFAWGPSIKQSLLDFERGLTEPAGREGRSSVAGRASR